MVEKLMEKPGKSKPPGKVHVYLGMKFIYGDDGKVKIDMQDYVQKMLADFPTELNQLIQV